MKKHLLIIVMLIFVLCVSCATPSLASDWSRFRGPNGTGVSPDTGLPAEIDRAKNAVWATSTR